MALPSPPYRCFLLLFVSVTELHLRFFFLLQSFPCITWAFNSFSHVLSYQPFFLSGRVSFKCLFPLHTLFNPLLSVLPLLHFFSTLAFLCLPKSPSLSCIPGWSKHLRAKFLSCIPLALLWWFWQDFRLRGLSASSQPAPIFKYPLFAGRYSLVPQTSWSINGSNNINQIRLWL